PQPVSGAAASLSCGNAQRPCSADLYLASAPERFDVETVDLVGGAPYVAPEPRACDQTDCDGLPNEYVRLRVGYLSDIASSGSRIAVILHPDPIRSATICAAQAPTQLLLFDDTSLTPIRTVPAPPCLIALTGDPGGGSGWVGASNGPAAALIRFDLDGQ